MAKKRNRDRNREHQRSTPASHVALVRIYRNGTCVAWDEERTQVMEFSEVRAEEVWSDLVKALTPEAKVFVQKILDGWTPLSDEERAGLERGESPVRAKW